MTQTATPTHPAAAAGARPAYAAALAETSVQRLDLYRVIHKAMRAFMADTLVRLGATDPLDEADTKQALDQVKQLLDACEHHLDNENRHVHPALERARPGSTRRIAQEHVEHEEAIDDLRDLNAFVHRQPATGRAAALLRLYQALGAFVAHNLEHMLAEETEHNAVLWAAYTDAQLHEIEAGIIASIAPQDIAGLLRWIVPSVHAGERAEMLTGMREGMRAAGAPPQAFEAVMDQAHGLLSPREWSKLCAALNRPAVPGLVSGV